MLVTVSGETIADIQKELVKVGKQFGLVLSSSDDEARAALQLARDVSPQNAEKRPVGRPRKDAGAAAPVANTSLDEPTPSVNPLSTPVAAAPVSESVTKEQALASLQFVFETKGPKGAQDILAKFGVDRWSLLKEEDYSKFVAACKAPA